MHTTTTRVHPPGDATQSPLSGASHHRTRRQRGPVPTRQGPNPTGRLSRCHLPHSSTAILVPTVVECQRRKTMLIAQLSNAEHRLRLLLLFKPDLAFIASRADNILYLSCSCLPRDVAPSTRRKDSMYRKLHLNSHRGEASTAPKSQRTMSCTNHNSDPWYSVAPLPRTTATTSGMSKFLRDRWWMREAVGMNLSGLSSHKGM